VIHFNVWICLPDGEQIQAGELITSQPDERNGAIQGEFRYSEVYLSHANAFPLDPNSLPLKRGIFDVDRPRAGIHGVFEDALPDDWGRRLLVRKHQLLPAQQRAPNLLACLGNSSMGALQFRQIGEPRESRVSDSPVTTLEGLLKAALAFDAGERVIESDLNLLFGAGSSPGGARPKALIRDENIDWIAKFPRLQDSYDVVRLEAASMQLAKLAGLDVPQHKIRSIGEHAVFFVRRFDITRRGRAHMISLQTLLKADHYYTLGYADVAAVIRKYCARPGEDLAKFYRQMVFNAAIGNTDDHLKNFILLHDDSGYHLSPAFDLLPDIGENRAHVLRFINEESPPTWEILLALAGRFNLNPRQATEILDSVVIAISHWREIFSDYQVPEKDVKRLAGDIDARLHRVEGSRHLLKNRHPRVGGDPW